MLFFKFVEPSSVRPQIIVTPRKVAAAIESVTQSVLAKNKKLSLSECVTPETPISLLPTTFSIFDIQSNQQSAPNQIDEQGSSNQLNLNITVPSTAAGSPSKSVIVRAGPSVCF